MGAGGDGPLMVDPDSQALFEMPASGPVRRVLVVDDDVDIRELVGQKLRLAGFDVVTAVDGTSALEVLSMSSFDVVVLDVAMPGLSGIDVCRQLRDDPRTADIAVIMLTARTNATFATLGYMAGADLYLSKPFSPRELVEQVKSIVDRRPEPRYGEDLPGPVGGSSASPESPRPAGSRDDTAPTDPAPTDAAPTDGRVSRWLRRGR